MFFCDTPTRKIYQFDYDARGRPPNRRLLYELPSSVSGGPDGAQCDAEGNLWAAISGAGQVVRITPEGVVDTVVELPVKMPTSVTIGGPQLDTLFITTRAENGRLDAGSLFACRIHDAIGVPEPEYIDRTSLSNADVLNPSVGRASAAPSAKFCSACGASFTKKSDRFCASCGAARG